MRYTLMICVAMLIAGCKPPAAPPTSRAVTATPATQVLQIPIPHRDGKRYDLVGNLWVSNLMGFPDSPLPPAGRQVLADSMKLEKSWMARAAVELATVGQILGMAEPSVFDTSNSTWQFQMSGGKAALVIRSAEECYSLVLIYSAGERIDANTADGSLEAWLLRDADDHFAPMRTCEQFLAGSKADRSHWPQSYALEGSMNSNASSTCLVHFMNLRLQSVSPLPPSDAYLKHQQNIYAFEAAKRGGVPLPLETIHTLDDYFTVPVADESSADFDRRMLWSVEYCKTHGATAKGTIEGQLYGGWHFPP